ncbi:ATPase, T2SS/T4P/T4SS family, partial [Vibrio diabolicus]|nr:Flp pilus assembly complex ATPase component TadA [Vibrio diabolicus]
MQLEECLQGMMTHKASDLYITVGAPVLYRVDGELRAQGEKLDEAQVSALLAAMMDEARHADYLATREANFAIVRDLGRFRVSAFFQRELPGAVIRRIETQIPTFDELKLPAVLKDLSIAKRGLVLVVGATGSGKSTTMAAMTGYRNTHRSGHILTVEDP